MDMDYYDMDGNGTIDYNDLYPEEMEALAEVCDANGDGVVDICEYH